MLFKSHWFARFHILPKKEARCSFIERRRLCFTLGLPCLSSQAGQLSFTKLHAVYLSHLLTPSAKQKQSWEPGPEVQATPSSLDTKVKFPPYWSIYAQWSWLSRFSRRDEDFFSCLYPNRCVWWCWSTYFLSQSVYRDLGCMLIQLLWALKCLKSFANPDTHGFTHCSFTTFLEMWWSHSDIS